MAGHRPVEAMADLRRRRAADNHPAVHRPGAEICRAPSAACRPAGKQVRRPEAAAVAEIVVAVEGIEAVAARMHRMDRANRHSIDDACVKTAYALFTRGECSTEV
jgi:hypothetical protein